MSPESLVVVRLGGCRSGHACLLEEVAVRGGRTNAPLRCGQVPRASRKRAPAGVVAGSGAHFIDFRRLKSL